MHEMISIILELIKKNTLYLVVFTTGACVLIIEVLATRILNPFYGSTIYSVSSILGIILAGLSLGYYYGGKLADNRPSYKLFYTIILMSGLSVLMLQFIKLTLLPGLATSFNIKSGPVFFSILLFIGPSFLLGLLSPFAIKMQSDTEKKNNVGTISGKVFFFSTIGSIIGSFLAGFYLIPNFGVDQILVGVSILLVLIGFSGSIKLDRSKFISRLFLINVLLILVNSLVVDQYSKNTLFATNGVYQRIYFINSYLDHKLAKVLMLDANPSAAVFYNSEEMAFEYSKYVELYEFFNDRAVNFLFIGGGGYNMPYELADREPLSDIDVVEIEPELFKIAKQQFGHPEVQNITNHVEDGRVFLSNTDKKYDMIVTDAYSDLYSIPVHLTSREFFQLGFDKLNERGIFICYIIGKLDDTQRVFALSEYKTFASVFNNNYVFAVDDPFSDNSQNILFVGYKSDRRIMLDDRKIGKRDEIDLSEHLIDMSEYDLDKQIVLTDNYAPVEALNFAMYDEL